ncbi:hypothetical protein GBAR_LOCUS27528 [Geodia barretti]|uniref:Uncharacterized protein n=1 Tax=Geodia barretti TaxID=519541 RepID=A0AA35TKW9_GEOBA|nr:hypothetical protein GBAR_LOCUS27528 [Geodia barretti]
MSIPPDQLCLTPVLESIQYILEEVLELPGKLCRQWLEMRGLSVIGVPLPSKPIVVLGLTV